MATNPLLTSIGYKVSTLEDVKTYAPAAFSLHENPNLSERYSFVPTHELLAAFESLNWHPAYARQNGSSEFSRHVIRLSNPDLGFMKLKSDKVKPQLLLDNSHNGGSPAQVHMGLFRLVCTNGLVVAMPGMYSQLKLRHVGIDMSELKQLLETVASHYVTIGSHIENMQQHMLNNDQREEFVVKAMAAREPHVFIKEDGTIDVNKVTTLVKPNQIIEPLRGEDESTDLWTTFNVVQERLVNGTFDRQTAKGRKTKPRGINNATRSINFNKALWEIAEEYMNA